MKRYLLIPILVFLLVSGINTGFAENPPESQSVFAADSHPWSIAYRDYFLTQTARQGDLTVSIEESVFAPEQAADLLARVAADIQIIAAKVPVVRKPCTVYVVETPLHGMIQQIGDAVYCTAGDVLSGAYRAELIAVMTELPAYWKCVGLSGVLFESSIDTVALRAYYEQADTLDILSLFPAYFLNVFTSEDDMLVARNTAISLTDYMINQYGMEPFLQTDRPKDRQDWLTLLGVSRDYSDPYAEALAEYRYSFWEEEYPLAVTTDHGDMIFIRYQEGDLDSPAQLRAFLYESKVGLQNILDGVALQAPEYLQAILDQYQKPVTVYCDPAQGNGSYPSQRMIRLRSSHNYLLYMMLYLTQPMSDDRPIYDTEYWKYHAVSRYMSIAFDQPPRTQKYYDQVAHKLLSKYDDPAKSIDGTEQSEEGFIHRFIQKYQEFYGSSVESWAEFDIGSYWDAIAWQQTLDRLVNPGVELVWASSIGSVHYWHIRKRGGNELTYFQAYSFGDYLISQQGLSPFLKYCLEDTEFDEAFGLPYEEAKEAWLHAMYERYQ
ncbi:MAG TPA: hypothetical protein P5559_11955 [Candidatus Limiplasma sp.]|nr:hypothetical protein [Candidatus Limiplasma sp.]